jgi:tRNA nucleotidyltransferase/poly(A) polymerase
MSNNLIIKNDFENFSYELYYVGGYVRDKILGIDSKDIDFTFVIKNNNNLLPKIDIEEGFRLMTEWLKKEGMLLVT